MDARAISYLDRLFRMRPAGRPRSRPRSSVCSSASVRFDELLAPSGGYRLEALAGDAGPSSTFAAGHDAARRAWRGPRRPASRSCAPHPRQARGPRWSHGAAGANLPRCQRSDVGDAARDPRCPARAPGRRKGGGARVAGAPERWQSHFSHKGHRVAGAAPRVRRAAADAGQRLGSALEQYVALLALVPEDREVEDGLRSWPTAGDPAGLTPRPHRRGAGQPRRDARRVELLMRAARVEDRQPGRKAAERRRALLRRRPRRQTAPARAPGGALRRLDVLHDELGSTGGATRRPRASGRGRAQSRRTSVSPGPGSRSWRADAATSFGRSPPGTGRLAVDPADAEALAPRAALARGRAMAGAHRASAASGGERARRSPDPRRSGRDRDAGPRRGSRNVGTGDRHLARVVSRFGEDDASIEALADLLRGERRIQGAGRAAQAARRRSAAGTPPGWRGWATRSVCKLGDPCVAVGGTRARWRSSPRTRGRGRATALLADASIALAAARRWRPPQPGPIAGSCCSTSCPCGWRARPIAAERVRILEDAAAAAETRAAIGSGRSPGCARRCRSRERAPALEHELLRLAETTGDFARAARALGGASRPAARPADAGPPARTARGRCWRCVSATWPRVRQLRGGARADARAAGPRRRPLRSRFAWATGGAAAPARRRGGIARDARHNVLLPLYESLAREARVCAPRPTALAQRRGRAPGLEASARRELTPASPPPCSTSVRSREAADAALARAMSADPRHVPTLRQRAELQRARGGDRGWWRRCRG